MTSSNFEISRENAAAYLHQRGWPGAVHSVTELGGGVSNIVLRVETGYGALVLKQALEKLRVEEDWRSERARVFRESGSLLRLEPHFPAGSLPRVLFEDQDHFLYAMTAGPQDSLPWKSWLMRGTVEVATARRIASYQRILMSLRDPEWQAAFGDQSVFDQLRLDPYYRFTARRHPDLRPQAEALLAATAGRRTGLVHGDWSPKNFLVDSKDPAAVLAIDFEVVHYGDPAFDTAFVLNHLLLKSVFRPQDAPAYRRAAVAYWQTLTEGLPGAAEFESHVIQHLGWLHLARVDGKSPVEYLTGTSEKATVRERARRIIQEPPDSLGEIFNWEDFFGTT